MVISTSCHLLFSWESDCQCEPGAYLGGAQLELSTTDPICMWNYKLFNTWNCVELGWTVPVSFKLMMGELTGFYCISFLCMLLFIVSRLSSPVTSSALQDEADKLWHPYFCRPVLCSECLKTFVSSWKEMGSINNKAKEGAGSSMTSTMEVFQWFYCSLCWQCWTKNSLLSCHSFLYWNNYVCVSRAMISHEVGSMFWKNSFLHEIKKCCR